MRIEDPKFVIDIVSNGASGVPLGYHLYLRVMKDERTRCAFKECWGSLPTLSGIKARAYKLRDLLGREQTQIVIEGRATNHHPHRRRTPKWIKETDHAQENRQEAVEEEGQESAEVEALDGGEADRLPQGPGESKRL